MKNCNCTDCECNTSINITYSLDYCECKFPEVEKFNKNFLTYQFRYCKKCNKPLKITLKYNYETK